MAGPSPTYEKIYDTIRRIPLGRVATYGQIAGLAGLPGHARQVGYALHALKSGSGVPWHRVINAQGRISLGQRMDGGQIQHLMLEEEGIEFDHRDRISLPEFGWRPEGETDFFL